MADINADFVAGETVHWSLRVKMPGYSFPLTGAADIQFRPAVGSVVIALNFSTNDGSLRFAAWDSNSQEVIWHLRANASRTVSLAGTYVGELVYRDGQHIDAIGPRIALTVTPRVTRVPIPADIAFSADESWPDPIDIAGVGESTLIEMLQRGAPGPAPTTRWVDGSVLEVQQQDGSWLASGDLRGPPTPTELTALATAAEVAAVAAATSSATAASSASAASESAAATAALTNSRLAAQDADISAAAGMAGAAQTAATAAQVSAATAAAAALGLRSDVAGALSASHLVETWAALAAITPSSGSGTRGEVLSDTGSHTDPITSASVANAGVYSYVTGSPAGWRRIGASSSASYAARSDILPVASSHLTYLGTDVVPVSIDGDGFVLLGRDATEGKRIGEAGYVFPLTKRLGVISYGQSNSYGQGAALLTTVTPYAHIKTFGSGVKSALSRSETWAPTDNVSPGVTTEIVAIEDANNNAWGLAAGETGLVQSLAYLTDLMAVGKGLAPGDKTLFCSTAGRGGHQISSLTTINDFILFVDQVRYAAARATDAGETFSIRSVRWIQGESDADATTTTATYTAALVALAKQCADMVWFTTQQVSPTLMFVYQTPHKVSTTQGRIALAQTAACAASPLLKFVTPGWHLARQNDGTHMTAQGQIHLGLYFARAEYQAIFEGRDPDYLRLISAVYSGAKLRLKYTVPTPPIVIDTTTWAAATQNGIRLYDGSGDIALSNFALASDGVTLTCDCARAPVVGAVAQVAMDYCSPSLAALATHGGASANLRDSTPDTRVVLGSTYPLYHVAPAARATVAILGN